jgi:hypothetical protein
MDRGLFANPSRRGTPALLASIPGRSTAGNLNRSAEFVHFASCTKVQDCNSIYRFAADGSTALQKTSGKRAARLRKDLQSSLNDRTGFR